MQTTTVGAAVPVSRFGLGTARLSNRADQAEATRVVAAAIERGVTYFDTAPFYEIGQAELAIGVALREIGDAPVTISTKVGRIVDPATGAWHYDFSRDGVLRSLDASFARLQRDHVDIVYVHDPDDHAAEASTGAIPALLQLRDEGVIGAVGVGMNQWQLPLEFVRNFDLDVLLIAGRYSLLDVSAADELFPVCIERGIGVVLGGVFNSGILADPSGQATFAYRPAAAEQLEMARRMQAIAVRHGFALADVAQAYSAAHPASTVVLIGVTDVAQLETNVAAWHRPIPDALWAELDAAGLLPRGGTLPQASGGGRL
ncbi:aldo/keto reductase [Microterricola gilva]|nr:aldo/keto reductase [Microterricola gilva]